MSKVVYWKIMQRGIGFYVVGFWTKPDQSNLLKEKFVIVDEARLRFRIEQVLGLKNFELKQVK